MIIMGPKKNGGDSMVSMIMEKLRGKSGESHDQMYKAQEDAVSKYGEQSSEDEMHYDMGMKAASKDMMEALKSNDVMKFMNAMKAFYEMCYHEKQRNSDKY